jgi:hypothetical protein
MALRGAACIAAALVVAASIPVLFGRPIRQIHIAWKVADTGRRVALEQRFRLSEAQALAGNRWSYVPLDTGPATLRAIVTDPAVASTDGIHLDRYVLSDTGPLTERRGGLMSPAPRQASQLAKAFVYLAGTVGTAFLLVAAFAATGATPGALILAGWRSFEWWWGALAAASARMMGVWRRRPTLSTAWTRTIDVLGFGVPVASAQAAGLFRVVFGTAVLLYVLSTPVSPLLSPYDVPRARGLYGVLIRFLAQHPGLIDALPTAILPIGLLFVAGVATSVSYGALVLLVLVWASVATLGTSHHALASLSICLVALVPARWGDGFSVDARIRRRAGEESAGSSRTYGFAMWIPTLVFGVAFVAAAWSKLREGPDWILNGTVKYHWLTDSSGALVPWGLELAAHPVLAVILSGVAVGIEALVLTSVFSRSWRYRVVCGLASIALLAGFALFQGVIWPGWWILTLGFLPWHLARRGSASATSRPLSAAQIAVVLVILLQQVYATWARVEARPLISAYDMYSTTYASPEAYEAASNLVFRVVGVTPSGSFDLPDCTIDDTAAQSFLRAVQGDANERVRIKGLIGECVDRRPDVVEVSIEGDKRVFNWQTRRFEWKRALDRIGPSDASWLRRASVDR